MQKKRATDETLWFLKHMTLLDSQSSKNVKSVVFPFHPVCSPLPQLLFNHLNEESKNKYVYDFFGNNQFQSCRAHLYTNIVWYK